MASIFICVVMAVGGFAQTVPQTPQGPPPRFETATQFYLRYRTVVANARSVDEVVALWAADAADEYRGAPAGQRVDLAGIKRMNSTVSNVTVTREEMSVGPGTADATLSLEGIGKDQKKVAGSAHVVKEEGVWKLVQPEVWK